MIGGRAAVLALIASFAGCGDAADTTPADVPTATLTQHTEDAVVDAFAAARRRVVTAPKDAKAWGAYGDLLGAYQFHALAAQCYREAETLQPDAFRWPYMQGLVLSGTSPRDASRAIDRALTLDDTYPLAHVRAGALAVEGGQADEALAHYEAALALDDTLAEAWIGAGRGALEAGDTDAAVERFERALALDATHPDALEAYSRALFAAGRVDASRDAAAKARANARKVIVDDPRGRFELSPISSQDFLRKGLALAARGQHENAAEAFAASLARNPESEEALRNLALACAQCQRFADSVTHYTALLQRRPDAVSDRVRLAAVLERTNDLDGARRELTRALTEEPESVVALRQFGAMALRQKKLPLALEHLGTAFALDPTPQAGLELARLHAQARQTDSALDVLDRVLAGDATVEALSMAAELYIEAERTGDAVNAARRAVQQQNGPATERLLANTLRAHAASSAASGDRAAARAAYDECLTLRSDWTPALRGLAWILATAPEEELRDGTRALALASAALAGAAKAEFGLLDAHAAALAATGDFAQAVTQGRAALESARAAGREDVAQRIAARVTLYESGQPYRAER